MKTVPSDSQQSIEQWVSQATGINTLGVKVQLRGNDLHILCEASECPQRWRTLFDLLQALQQTDLDVLTNSDKSSIYQVFVYGRKKGELEPQWCHRVYLNQLEQHLAQAKEALLEDAEKSSRPGGALIVSNESLAQKGDPEAIARYLSETLSSLGVAVEVQVKKQSSTQNKERLWIFCQSSYHPDPSLIAEPVAFKLRELKLSGYEDAVIASVVKGETTYDWLLRIDLTPKEEMLKQWARWGDVQAIVRLLNLALANSRVSVEANLKESTLHIFCTHAEATCEPEKTACLEVIAPQLEAIAPQGILRAAVYGQKTNQHQPNWIDWQYLPGSEHQALSLSTLELASGGDEEALVFLLERLLNPNLDLRLKTGGIRVLVLRKEDLLHIMCDAPVCPARKQVSHLVTEFIRSLHMNGVAGVRVYGRRAGNKEPFWHHGVDLKHRQRLVPEATPEFAATCAYVGELLPSPTSEPVLRPRLTSQEVHNVVTAVAQDWGGGAKKLLLETQLLVETDSASEQKSDYHSLKVESDRSEQAKSAGGFKVALVWGALGLLLTLQIDWVLSQIVTNTTLSKPIAASAKNQNQRNAFFANTAKQKVARDSTFNASNFTSTDDNSPATNLTATPLKQKATATAILLSARSRNGATAKMPSFNTRQLDEQLALYKQRLAKTGSPPQVLIIGSSRALRGIDPVALSQGLATQGYANIDVFNFGINGATAQVVDFVIRQVLQPSELPKIIVWADGSRAFNSGREDITFNAIAASPGYKQSLQTTNVDVLNSASTTKKQIKSEQQQDSYKALNQWLNQALANVSPAYQKRDLLKNLLNQQLNNFPLIGNLNSSIKTPKNQVDTEDAGQQAVDFDGFLPLSVRFQPVTYYQKHPKVSGSFDNDYQSFNLQGEQEIALQTLLEFTTSRKISLVFVNMPLSRDYLDPVRTKYEQEFQLYMSSLADNPNFIYRDLSQFLSELNDYFSDPSHLNRYGAYKVSKKLANDPMIPWSMK
ncbi:DUF1574 domain-containing protein [Iningainema tapete]|uniref:DUF1574 domain-containing protein n=1 Tax=Iningainema tapete BLCC-T55 TaxID=2748662 RepID=A0A8J7C941_9CYAN|nr:DUF1574 domain-containing protein [Iningainema tapete]MBD2777659.1 DUF1574 domain-containing protein [Iningainema tapete BLCC-T55]